MRHISYSYLHLLACPYAAFLRYEAAIRSPLNEYLALGNSLHSALELTYKENERFDGKWCADYFVKDFHRLLDTNDVFIGYPKKKKMEAEGLNMLALYARGVERGEISLTPLAHEVEFKIPYEGIDVVGKIDKVEWSQEEGYTIIDYKSGSAEPDEWFLRHNLQLTAYAWACLELYGELPTKLIWHHLRNGKLLETDRTMQDITDLKKMISSAIFMEKNDIRFRIFHEKICGWCDYAGDTCDDHELEERVVRERDTRRGNTKGAA